MDLNFKHEINGKNLVIAIAQDYKTLEVLMVAYMNKEALQKTFDTGKVHYWSTSRNKIWLKGESSGNFQIVKDIYVDCDEDAILLKVKQIGGACHEGYFSCFFRTMSEKDENGFNLVKKVVKKRVFDPEKVYEEKK
ncbi:MAG: phosphoribosyl-AMP cyclohydrolase [Euryarchaeota archaeon]|nr:phosphoribosyl-AMP cyclohydrolase [Euryarchaeota archaeon]